MDWTEARSGGPLKALFELLDTANLSAVVWETLGGNPQDLMRIKKRLQDEEIEVR